MMNKLMRAEWYRLMHSGSGSGLYVAKRLAEKYGGELTAATENTMFRIDLILPINDEVC